MALADLLIILQEIRDGPDRVKGGTVNARIIGRESIGPYKTTQSILLSLRGVARVILSPARIGFVGALGTAHDVYWERAATRLAWLRVILHKIHRRVFPMHGVISPEYIRKHKNDMLLRGNHGYRIRTDEICTRRIEGSPPGTQEILLGEFDHDGFVRSEVGPLAGIPTVSPEAFMPRKRFTLTLVSRNGFLGVRKDFHGDLKAFLQEVHALDVLARAKCNVPALLDVDLESLQIVTSYIAGPVLREAVAKLCPVVRDRDVQRHEFGKLEPTEQRLARIREARKVLHDVVDDEFIEELFRQIQIMHSRRFMWCDIKYGNVLIEKYSGKPYLIDFEQATHHPGLGRRSFRYLSDRDREGFNLHFGTGKLTTKRLRRLAKAIPASDVYAPACFAAGTTIGSLWNNNTGDGRWRFMLQKALPPIQGARILDLGANNGFNALQLLRNGAREVVAVELDPKNIEQGRFLQAAFEYTDCTDYPFRYVHANMKDVAKMKLGRFDFVMALCSIYYLDDDEIEALTRHLSSITHTLVLQCNTEVDIGRRYERTYEKASLEYARKILRLAGFTDIQIVAPARYSRPLAIGRQPQPKETFAEPARPEPGVGPTQVPVPSAEQVRFSTPGRV